ncbi:hypothetical protein Fuma_04478 [Fuerstiella marisgermanici]|uniref:Uncharacterized protein n=2 Tax=Fuerstiella marisgermanici TaxID=1891926 RepID=A0A1P8WL89_9PLAN|nr:hypothetical protein Fuma_04478 [Fuerstiella marisgermanici]
MSDVATNPQTRYEWWVKHEGPEPWDRIYSHPFGRCIDVPQAGDFESIEQYGRIATQGIQWWHDQDYLAALRMILKYEDWPLYYLREKPPRYIQQAEFFGEDSGIDWVSMRLEQWDFWQSDLGSPQSQDFLRWQQIGTPLEELIVRISEDFQCDHTAEWEPSWPGKFPPPRTNESSNNKDYCPTIDDIIGNIPSNLAADGLSQSDWRYHVTATCARRWRETPFRLAFRWIIEPMGFANITREATLAGIRLWCQRISHLPVPCRHRDDFQHVNSIAKLVVGQLPIGFSDEAPSCLLGFDERDVLRLSFPLFHIELAEDSIPHEQLLEEWERCKDDEVFESFDDFKADRTTFYGSSWCDEGSLGFAPREVDIEYTVKTVCYRLLSNVINEAKRFGRQLFESVPPFDSPAEALKLINHITADVAAMGTELASTAPPSSCVTADQPMPTERADNSISSAAAPPEQTTPQSNEAEILTRISQLIVPGQFPALILSTFAKSPNRFFSATALSGALPEDFDALRINDHIAKVRAAIRNEFDIPAGRQNDPLPNTAGHGWKLDVKLIERFLSIDGESTMRRQ